MIDNAYFSDIIGFSFSTEFNEFIKIDNTGYFVTLKLKRNDVPLFMEHDIIPIHIGNGVFVLKVHLSNVTDIRFNNLKIRNLGDDRLLKIPVSNIDLNEIALKRYSIKTYKTTSCYATKMLIDIKKEGFSA